MELILKRIAKKKAYTIGRLSLSTKSLTPDPSPEGEGSDYTSGQNSLTPSPSPGGEGSDYSHGMYEVQGNSQENYLLPSPSGEGQGVRLFGEGQGVRLGASYFCDTLEPTWRDYAGGARKVNGCSAIPEGRYAVVITWSPKFNEWLPLLLGDAEFRRCWSGIRIHAGNTPGDTAGCILVGENKAVGKVYNSRIWLHRLKKLIVEAKDRGEPVWMTVR